MRHLLILQALPIEPVKVDSRSLQQRLESHGIYCSLRTVQRDLEFLEGCSLFRLVSDRRSKPVGWSWMRGCKTSYKAFSDFNVAIRPTALEPPIYSVVEHSEKYRGKVHLKLKVNQHAIEGISKTPFSVDQIIRKVDRNNYTLIADIEDTQRLRQRLLSLGDSAEVVEPAILVAFIKQQLRAMSNCYFPDGDSQGP